MQVAIVLAQQRAGAFLVYSRIHHLILMGLSCGNRGYEGKRELIQFRLDISSNLNWKWFIILLCKRLQ